MNTSIISLSLINTNSYSPFFLTHSHISFKRFFSYKTTFINIFSNNCLKITESQFSYCQCACIRINSLYEGFKVFQQKIGPFSQDIVIEYSIFRNLGNRAIADTSSFSVSLYRVIFSDIYSSSLGGAIYKKSGSIYSSFCCFEFCRSSSDNGNLLYYDSLSDVSIISSTIFNCWKDTNCAAHTSYVHSEKCIIKFVNCTNNKNRLLSCVIEPTTCKNAEFAFCHYFLGYSSGICHPMGSSFTMSHINIIKNTGTVAFFAFYKSSIRLENCYLFQNIHPKLHYYNAGVYSNCFGDFSFSGISIRSSVITFFLNLEYPINCIPVFTIPTSISMTSIFINYPLYIVLLSLIST